jgi:hypothetical protein
MRAEDAEASKAGLPRALLEEEATGAKTEQEQVA